MRSTRWLLLAGLALGVAVGFAWGPTQPDVRLASLDQWAHASTGRRLDRVLDRLDATGEQRTQAHRIVSRAIVDLQPWPDAMTRLRGDLQAAWESDAPDRDALHRRIDEEAEALRTLGHALVEDAIEVHGVLTPEQRRAVLERLERGRGWP